jgi:hypothetical protein
LRYYPHNLHGQVLKVYISIRTSVTTLYDRLLKIFFGNSKKIIRGKSAFER